MKKVKLIAILTALTMTLGCFAGCGDSDSSSEAENTASGSESQAEETEEVVLERTGEMRGLTATELVAEMTTGWNLGNSLDSEAAGLEAETAWNNPKTTKAMIDAVVARGFDVIRIPVTWNEHMGEGPDYTVDEAWMDRVQEVVNYAIDNDVYVILNAHHEEPWRIPDNEHIDAVDEQHQALWRQIAERFKDYGDKLIFEGLNEPRIEGGVNEWNGGTEEGRRCIDRLNQSFIDVVRATGGNNETRLLLVTTFATQAVSQAINDVAIPDDDYVAFSIHAYTPYAFTYHSGETWELYNWDGTRISEIEGVFSGLKSAFLDKGIPVIITEYGAVNKFYSDEQQEETGELVNEAEVVKWVTDYLTIAKSYGIPCVWWDNNEYISSGELFGIFDRDNMTWFTEDVPDAIMAVYEDSGDTADSEEAADSEESTDAAA